MAQRLFRTARSETPDVIISYGLIYGLVLFLVICGIANAERCTVCEEEITGDKIYLVIDRVTNDKKHLCSACVNAPEACFACGLPVRHDYTTLSDGRILCARDVQNAILDPNDAKAICAQVRSDLNRLFFGFTSFPTDPTIALVDRVNLTTLFKVPENDRHCPNVLGYFRTQTNDHQVTREISLLSALTSAQLQAVCAHEYSHAWIAENLLERRKATLARDAEEGFCELVSYLLMDSQQDDAGREAILHNEYTRGQIQFFLEAHRLFGMNAILQWMRFGSTSQLDGENLYKIKELGIPTLAVAKASEPRGSVPEPESAGMEDLALKGISWLPGRSLALINDRSLARGESATIRMGTTNLLIKCLTISRASVRIEIVGSGEERELWLK